MLVGALCSQRVTESGIGNGALELIDDQRRKAFELFRSNSKDVEIVTYDELFRKLEVLAALFSLSRS